MKIIKIMWKILKVFFTLVGGYVTFTNVLAICGWAKRHGLKGSLKHWVDLVMTASDGIVNW